jgi:hypothetical protein
MNLSKIGAMDKPREIQGRQLVSPPTNSSSCASDLASRHKDNPSQCLKTATLEEFYEESTKQNGRVLNALDMPIGADLCRLPQYE